MVAVFSQEFVITNNGAPIWQRRQSARKTALFWRENADTRVPGPTHVVEVCQMPCVQRDIID